MSGIYIHIPFCKQKCHYCNFHFSISLKYKNEMVEAILREIRLTPNPSPKERGEEVKTIYFGGGTPSLLSKNDLEKIFEQLHKYFSIDKNAEITLECNPDDLTKEKIAELKSVGINRLSIGVQSFFDEDLKFMNRAHDAEQAKKSILLAKEFFENITMDLIYGTPTMSNLQWEKNLEIFFSFQLPHLSAYSLTVEPKTTLAKFIEQKKVKPIEEEKSAQQFEILMEKMKEKNYLHYEISNFCRPSPDLSPKGRGERTEYFSRHNSSYWKGEKYFGFGPSAHSYDGNSRWWNVANNATYIKSIQEKKIPFEKEILTPEQKFNEYILLSLRTMWGIDLEKMKNDFGEEKQKHFVKNAGKFIADKLIIQENEKMILSDKGKSLANRIVSDLFIV